MPSGGSLSCAEPVATAAEGTTTAATDTWVLFLLDDQTYALQIWEVERIVRAVEVKPLPEAPGYVRGVVNVQGKVLPVVDLRVRFGLPSRDIRLEDHFIVARTPTHSVVLPVDAALGSVQVANGCSPEAQETRAGCVRKVATVDHEVVYSLDLQRVLFADASPANSDFASVLAELETT